VTVLARSLPDVGAVLVDSQGYALYVFAPDDHRAMTCTGTCLGTWPPLMLPSGDALAVGSGVKSTLLGSDPDPAGGRVVTYDGWPLYTFTGDTQPGQATGQDIDLNGGKWYVIRPSGQPLIPRSG
jgi:predicted lipoprotein with Yx(FWY)xxD motif